MMPFHKYQGAGNDFVMIDARQQAWLDPQDSARIAWLCDRRFGIGADGLILLQARAGYDFEMRYFNADGREGSLCGNGGRCAVAFARALGCFSGQSCRFLASDGPHEALLSEDGEVGLHMHDVADIACPSGDYVLDTGSPHYVRFTAALDAVDVYAEGRALRQSPPYAVAGINVNFVEVAGPGQLRVATYERGVEDETLACGTGVTAAALSLALREAWAEGPHAVAIRTKGGALAVRFRLGPGGRFSDIWLHGPATFVFEGRIP